MKSSPKGGSPSEAELFDRKSSSKSEDDYKNDSEEEKESEEEKSKGKESIKETKKTGMQNRL